MDLLQLNPLMLLIETDVIIPAQNDFLYVSPPNTLVPVPGVSSGSKASTSRDKCIPSTL